MIELQGLTEAALDKMHADGRIQAILEKQIEQTIQRTVSDVLGEYGEFGKALKEEIKSKLKVDPQAVRLSEYNLVVAKVLQKKLDEYLIKEGVGHMQTLVDDMLVTPPDSYKFSEIIDTMMNEHEEEALEHRWSQPSVHSEGGTLNFIYFDPEPRKDKYQCRYGITLDKDGTCVSVKMREWGGDKFTRELFVRSFRGLERMMFHLYAKSTKLIFTDKDRDSLDDFYYPGQD